MHEAPDRIAGNAAAAEQASTAALALSVSQVRLVVLDDVTLYRDGLKLILSGHEGLCVVGEGPPDRDGVRLVCSLNPDVVLIEASATHSTTIVRDLTRLAPKARVLAYGVEAGDHEAIQCAEAGVAGYVPKNATTTELIATVVSVARGEFACSPRVAALLLRRISDLASQRRDSATDVVLTSRERQVGVLIDDGLSNKEIAGRLGIGVSTVKNHVHHILAKLHASGRVQAAAQIRRAQI